MTEVPEEYPQPETVVVDRPTPTSAPVVAPPPWSLMQASIGHLLVVPSDSAVPDGWLKCEETELVVKEWPEFCDALGIDDLGPDDTFTLPDANNTETQMFIIRMR